MRAESIFQIRKSRFLWLIFSRPLAFTAACGFIALGVASGLSTGSLLNMGDLLFVADKLLWHFSLIRTACFDLLLVCAAQSAVYHRAAIPFACAALSLKGMTIGFSLRQLLLELQFIRSLPALLIVVFSSLPVLTALIVSFLCSGLGAKHDTLPVGDNYEKAWYSSQLALFLVLLSIVAEGLAAPPVLRLVYDGMV